MLIYIKMNYTYDKLPYIDYHNTRCVFQYFEYQNFTTVVLYK